MEQDIPPAVSWFSNCVCGPGRKENPSPPLSLWDRMVFPFAIHTHIRTHTHTHHVFVRYGHSISQPPLVEQDGFPFAIHTHTPCLCQCMAILSPNPPPVEQDGFPFCSETHTHTHTPVLFSIASLLWKLRLSQGASRAGQAGYDTGAARL